MESIPNNEIQMTVMKAHSNLFLGKRYYQLLRNIYRNIILEDSQRSLKRALEGSVNALNNTLGSGAFVAFALVFGEFSTVCIRSEINL